MWHALAILLSLFRPALHQTGVLTLTVSLAGMGKSTVSNVFGELGVPVFDADQVSTCNRTIHWTSTLRWAHCTINPHACVQAVHAMYGKGGQAVDPIGANFPEAIIEGGMCDHSHSGVKTSLAVKQKRDC